MSKSKPKRIMNNYLAVSVIGPEENDFLHRITHIVSESQCSIVESQVTRLGNELAAHILLSGRWNQIAKVENSLLQRFNEEEIVLTLRRCEHPRPKGDRLHCVANILALDEPTLLDQVLDFFRHQDASIIRLSSHTYHAQRTQSLMLAINVDITVPSNTHVAELRDQFTLFCDELNLDGILELEKV